MNGYIKNIDYILGTGLKLNEYVSVGVGGSYSSANFNSNRLIGFPGLNLPDSQSNNITHGDNYGWNAGLLIKPNKSAHIGFNYRSAVAYQFKGSSQFQGPPVMISNHFDFNFWTPARSVLTVSQLLTPTTGLITTVQRIQWGVFKNVTMHGLATQIGARSMILPIVDVPYYFQDTWVLTVGGIKKVTPKWVIRLAGTYNQSPGNGAYRITSGDDYVLGGSTGYKISKNLTIDGGYAHAFTKNKSINIVTARKQVIGINRGYRNAVSLKLTLSV